MGPDLRFLWPIVTVCMRDFPDGRGDPLRQGK